MRYPLILGYQLQSLWIRCATRMVTETLLVTQHHVHRRKADDHAPAKPVADGPDLKDRYGHRAHDVDVERI